VSGHAAGLGYYQLRLFTRLLTYSRPMKYPAASTAASRTITIRIARDAGSELRITEEYMSNRDRYWRHLDSWPNASPRSWLIVHLSPPRRQPVPGGRTRSGRILPVKVPVIVRGIFPTIAGGC
jgi:hypothetical protein